MEELLEIPVTCLRARQKRYTVPNLQKDIPGATATGMILMTTGNIDLVGVMIRGEEESIKAKGEVKTNYVITFG